MPDDITRHDGRDLVAVNWTRGHPWHRLGQQAAEDMTIEKGLELVGVKDEEISLVPLYERKRRPHPELDREIEVFQEIPVAYSGVKSSVFGIMGVVGDRYTPTPRRDLLELAYEIVGLENSGAHVDTIGILGDHGETFFSYIQVPELVIDPNGIADHIERGLFLASAYDGSMSNIIGYSNIRVVCRNTLNMAMKQGQQIIKARHTKNVKDRIRQAAVALQYAGAVEQQVIKNAETMLKVDGEKALTTLQDHFWDLEEEGLGNKALAQRSRKRNAVRRLYEDPDGTNSNLVGQNGWSAYNAFVEYSDHERDVQVSKGDVGVARAKTAVLPGATVDSKIKASELVLALAA